MEIRPYKRQKPNGFSYPNIPLSDQDRDHHEETNDPFIIRPVQAFAPEEIVKGDSFRAESITRVDTSNERLVRSCHPSLSSKKKVWVSRSIFGEPVWLVDSPLGDSKSVFAGGRPIHYLLRDYTQYVPELILTPRTPIDMNRHFHRFINPRRFLRPTDLDGIRELFPEATGVEIFIAGFMVITFDDMHHVQDAYADTWPLELAGLRVFFDVVRYDLTASAIEYGLGLSTSPGLESECRAGSVGLKVQLQDGSMAITTVTHGFVHLPGGSKMNHVKSLVQHMLNKAKESLRRYLPARVRENTTLVMPSGVQRRDLTNNPIGRGVWTAESHRMVGTITRTYDQPSSTRPYPAGYTHDLSLITGPTLPNITSPPGYPPITEWANYSPALDGRVDVFCVCQRGDQMPWRAIEGEIDPTLFTRATVLGSGWRWDRSKNCQNAFLLWHTSGEMAPADGWSGSPLCVGSRSDPTAKAVVFQNFQRFCRLSGEETMIKGGFLLPTEIRNSTIISVPRQDQHNPFNTLPGRSRTSTEVAPERRSFSAV